MCEKRAKCCNTANASRYSCHLFDFILPQVAANSTVLFILKQPAASSTQEMTEGL